MAEVTDTKTQNAALLNKTFREFKGVVTKGTRYSIPEDAFYDLTNLMPIGPSNCQTVPDKSAILVNYGTDIIYWSQFVQIGNVGYLLQFSNTGKVFAYNIANGVSTQVGAGLSGSNSRLAQFKNVVVLIIDSTGYYSWDGSTFLNIAGGSVAWQNNTPVIVQWQNNFLATITWTGTTANAGIPTTGVEIAVYASRVWIVQGRTIAFSGADDGSATPWTTLWTVSSGAGFVQMTDPTIKGAVTRLWVQNGYLYIYSASSINIIADVYVPTGAIPPTPIFSNTNINAVVGTDQAGSVFAFGRSICFATQYGIYQMYGVAEQRISEDIDGTWQYVDFTQALSGGVARVNNILCAAVLFRKLNDPVIPARTVLGMYFDKKWWFANYGALTLVTTALVNNVPTLYGYINNQLYQLFSTVSNGVTTASPATQAMTPLWAMEDVLTKKRVIRAGIQTVASVQTGTPALTVDTSNSSTVVTGSTSSGVIQWQNNTPIIVNWTNNALSQIQWIGGSLLIFSGDPPGAFDNYVGMTYTNTASVYQLNAFFMDYKHGARWG